MEDFFIIDIPVFMPCYEKDKKYGWSKHKDDLWELLKVTTGGYCMYCYDSIWINGQRRGQIEHGIEKINSLEYLTDCVPNLGIACENCNDKYKKRGEGKRRLSIESIKKFETVGCKRYDCKEPCDKYKELRMEYIKKGKIMVQPFEVKKGERGNVLKLQSDLLKCKYIPNRNEKYDAEELEIIDEHIKLFRLNSPERKNFEIGRYCENVIDNKSIMRGVAYDNLVVNLFRAKLSCLNVEKAVKICEIIYNNAFRQLAT